MKRSVTDVGNIRWCFLGRRCVRLYLTPLHTPMVGVKRTHPIEVSTQHRRDDVGRRKRQHAGLEVGAGCHADAVKGRQLLRKFVGALLRALAWVSTPILGPQHFCARRGVPVSEGGFTVGAIADAIMDCPLPSDSSVSATIESPLPILAALYLCTSPRCTQGLSLLRIARRGIRSRPAPVHSYTETSTVWKCI